MSRKISLETLRKVVNDAYENSKADGTGAVRALYSQSANEKDFAISVVLADGTVINKGNTDSAFALDDIARIPVSSVLLTQKSVDDLVKDSGTMPRKKNQLYKPDLCVAPHAVRAVSAITPKGDPEGKYDIIINNLINMMGTEPVMNDKIYEATMACLSKNNAPKELADAKYELYDDVNESLEIMAKLSSLTANAQQVATMIATIAADGVNPSTKQIAFDGSISSRIVTLMATLGQHRVRRAWLMETGLPARFANSGAIAAILPGVGGFVAYSPRVDEYGLSVRGAKALRYIAENLQLCVFDSAKVKFLAEVNA